jgi:hypothetical protein
MGERKCDIAHCTDKKALRNAGPFFGHLLAEAGAATSSIVVSGRTI